MHIISTDKSKVFKYLKDNMRCNSNLPSSLQTPVGSFHADDVLEGFASDAEYLGRQDDDDDSCFDRSFYKLCKLDNIYIFEVTDELE